MSHQFKPGDLALIVGHRYKATNVGKSGVLQCVVAPGEEVLFPHTFHGYRCAGIFNKGDRPLWFMVGDSLFSSAGAQGFVLVHESNLMPLKGDEQPAQVRQAERVQ